MERRDLYQDDLTEERYPSPARRDDAAATERLDPDIVEDGAGGGDQDGEDEDLEDDLD